MYAPGVQDQRGQLLGAGIQQFGQAATQGYREYQANQDKDRSARSIVTGILSQSPDLVKNVDPDTLKLLDKFKSGNTGLDDNVYLAGMIATAAKQKGEAQQQAAQAQQMQMQALQMQATQAQLADQQRQQQFGKTLDQFNNGVGNGVLSPQAQSAQQNPYFQLAAQVRQGTGQTMTAKEMADVLEKQQALNKPLKNNPQELTLPSGNRVAFSPSTGAFSVLPQSPDQVSSTETAKIDAQKTVDDAHTLLGSVADSAETSRVRSGTIGRIIGLYQQGATSGFGQPTLTAAQAALQRVGLAPKGVANQQQLEKELNTLVLESGRDLMKGQGAVSNYERAAVKDASANASSDPQANIAVLNVLKAIGDRNVLLDKTRIQMDDQGKSSVEIARALRQIRDSVPVGVESLGQTPANHINDLLNKYK